MFKEYGPYDSQGYPSRYELFCDVCGDLIISDYDGLLNESHAFFIHDDLIKFVFNFGSCAGMSDWLGFNDCCNKCKPKVITYLTPMADIYLLRRFVNKLQSKINERKRNDRKNDNRQIA